MRHRRAVTTFRSDRTLRWALMAVATSGCSTASGPSGGDVAVAVAVGLVHSCALTAGGEVWCWGNGERGQLGIDDDSIPREEFDLPRARTPMRVPLSGIALLAVGGTNTCAVRRGEPGLLCWGDNLLGQLGPGVGGYSTAPIELFAGTPVRQASINFGVICVVTASDAVECVGPKESFAVAGSRMLGEDGYPERYRSVSVGAANVCAVSVANLAYCWGENRTGRVRPDTAVENPERPVFMAEDVASITAGITYTCAALGNGDVRCWGRNLFGDPLDTLSSRVGRVRAIAVGTQATWVLGEDGSVWSWGPAHPVTGGTDLGPINPGFRAETVAAGFGHACALGRDGAAWCWGSNLYGQLGTGVRSSSIVPVRVFPRNR